MATLGKCLVFAIKYAPEMNHLYWAPRQSGEVPEMNGIAQAGTEAAHVLGIPWLPQVMAVLCAPENNTKPGRVVEITLAAPSL